MEENKRAILVTRNKTYPNDEIDFKELAIELWRERKLIQKSCVLAAIIGIVVAFSIPKEYTTMVKLSPELSGKERGMGGLGALAGMAGINLGNSGGPDALSPQLYPDIVQSIQFTTELFNIPVETEDEKIRTSVFNYLSEYNKYPWWKVLKSLPSKTIGLIVSVFKGNEAEIPLPLEKGDLFQLSHKEMGIVNTLRDRINVVVDKNTFVITLSVEMQDPLISATLTDSVMMRLQNYITDYRTTKARHDLENTKKMFEEARQKYYLVQQKYANYLDKNQNLSLESVRTERERLQNETNLAFNLYNQMAQQLQMSKLKVQESTPVFTIVEAVSVPLVPSSPSKLKVIILFLFIGIAISSLWVIYVRALISDVKHLFKVGR